MNISELKLEELVCTEYSQYNEKTHAYKYKYYGNGHAIVNIYVPSDVIEVLIIEGNKEKITKCELIPSIAYQNAKVVYSDILPVDLTKNPANTISIVVCSVAHPFFNKPNVYISSEFIHGIDNSISQPLHIDELKNNSYQHTEDYLSQSKPMQIVRTNSQQYIQQFSHQSPSSIPLSEISFTKSPHKSTNLGDIIKTYKNGENTKEWRGK